MKKNILISVLFAIAATIWVFDWQLVQKKKTEAEAASAHETSLLLKKIDSLGYSTFLHLTDDQGPIKQPDGSFFFYSASKNIHCDTIFHDCCTYYICNRKPRRP